MTLCFDLLCYSTMKCFKIRTGDGCTQGNYLHCSMRSRSKQINEDSLLVVGALQRSVTMYSPGHNQSRPHYFNRNFCIYNISLNCPSEVITLNSKPNTLPLSDNLNNTCDDYLLFEATSSNGISYDRKVCGNQIVNFNATMTANSLLAVLWTNGDNSAGKFEIEAMCAAVPTEESGESANHN